MSLVDTRMTPTEVDARATAPARADVAVAIVGTSHAGSLDPVLEAAERGLAAYAPGRSGIILLADQSGPTGEVLVGEALGDSSRVRRLSVASDGQRTGPRATRHQLLKLVFESAAGLGSKALAVVDANFSTIEPAAIGRLLGPVLDNRADYVGPYYARPGFSGAITGGIVYPFTRALYGRRLRFPAGSEFACSIRFVQAVSADVSWVGAGDGGRIGTDLWLVHRALTGGFRLSESVVGTRPSLAGDEDTELSAILARVLGGLFIEAERNVQIWQRIRGSEAVTLIGTPGDATQTPPAIDLAKTTSAFRLGLEHLMPVWASVLPPSTLHELRKLWRRGPAEFQLPDPIWARIVYDFAIGFHGRVMTREHLLSAFTPLYLGWLASYATEMAGADLARCESRLEELCARFEIEKPYLISRWRWPDRFSP